MWEFVGYLSMRPQVKQRPRSFNGRMLTSEKTRHAENEIKKQLCLQGARSFKSYVDISIELHFQMPKKLTQPMPRGDVDNYAKLVLDAIQPWMIIDDRYVRRLEVEKRYAETEGVILKVKTADMTKQHVRVINLINRLDGG